MDGYRQTLLGRALADALQELEKEQEDGGDGNAADLEVDGDLVFSLFDEAVKLELHDRPSKGQDRSVQTFTHDSLELTGQATAFNRFMDDWSVLACMTPHNIQLNHGLADLHLPLQGQEQQEQEVAMRLKLRKKE